MRKKEAAAKAKAKAKAAATKAKALAAQKKKAKEEADAREADAREAQASVTVSSVSRMDSVVESEPLEDGTAAVWSRRPTPYMWALSATYQAIAPLPITTDELMMPMPMLNLSGSAKQIGIESEVDDCEAIDCCFLGRVMR
eukprot:TRINITY_DN1653_c0_g1_i3.p4 TRINITY_DN1653_c0_g1~~TRINITY_DN1653_c0_g1_i3.p4  ORF type:complete len:141 (+),score=30.82 TRINITY_DN1653_c0_g1_i3:402-824(+)